MTVPLFNFRSLPGRTEPFAVEIGFTWVGGAAQRSGINVEAKLLLMTYAFEELGVQRVEFKTDARNERSRRALAGLGAQFEGVLRKFSPSWAPREDGLLRDSAMYSVISGEWEAALTPGARGRSRRWRRRARGRRVRRPRPGRARRAGGRRRPRPGRRPRPASAR
jgi:hypothetical protein